MRLFSVLILMFFTQLHSLSDVERLISEASVRNTYFLYEDAIKLLDEAIEKEPCDKEAYKERAFSYFELNRIELAFEDYKRAVNPKPLYKRYPQGYSLTLSSLSSSNVSRSLDFAKGLLYGAMLGGKEGSVQFVSSVRGGLTLFLKEQKILQCPRKLNFERGGITTYKYTKNMGKHKIVALFEINKKNLPLLRNAWIEAEIPYGP